MTMNLINLRRIIQEARIRTEFKAFAFATLICMGLVSFYVGISLVVYGMFGDVFIWKQILLGAMFCFVGLFVAFVTVNYSLITRKEKNK